MPPSQRKSLRLCGALLLGFAFLAVLCLWPEIAILIGLGFAVCHTVRYLRSLPEERTSFWKKTRKWIVNLWDSICGIG